MTAVAEAMGGSFPAHEFCLDPQLWFRAYHSFEKKLTYAFSGG